MQRVLVAPAIFAATLAICVFASPSRAELYLYSIVQNQSQINLTAGGSFLNGALTVTEQNANAITRYNGTIGVDASIGGPDFSGAGSANAVNTTGLFNLPNQYQPGPNNTTQGPANYGVIMEAPVGFDLPAIPINGTEIDLGVLQSIVAKVALRDIALQFHSPGDLPLTGNNFDASQTSVEIIGGHADISLAARLDQDNALVTIAVYAALQLLAGSYPDLGVTITPNFIQSYIDVGINTALPLTGLGIFPNMTPTAGSITGLTGPPGPSTLILPVLFDVSQSLAGIVNLTFNFSGSLRATATIPETSSLVLASLASVAAVGGFYRRKRRTA